MDIDLRTLAPGALVLCATELQARLWRREHAHARLTDGAPAWESPRILSLGRWVREFWLASWPAEELISRSKERRLWQQLLAADPAHTQLLAPDRMAESLMQAWNLCQRQDLAPMDEPRWTTEQELYARLHRAMEGTLAARGWCTDAELGRRVLRQGLDSDNAMTPARDAPVWAYGFLPAQTSVVEQRLLDSLGAHHIETRPNGPDTVGPQAIVCRDRALQWQQAAETVRALLHAEPAARVVVAVPELAQKVDALDVHWGPRLAAADMHADSEEAPLPWSVEHPRPLARLPAIATLLTLTEWSRARMPMSQLARLLQQPLLIDPEQRHALALAERRLRERGVLFSIRDLCSALPDDADDTLLLALDALEQIIGDEPDHASASTWVAHWQCRWSAWPWRDSTPHWPLREDFQADLATFLSVADDAETLPRREALRLLREVMNDHFHSPRRAHEAPILICDWTQAHGLPCTHRLLLDADATALPRAQPATPWLNPELLRRAHHPSASPAHSLRAERERTLALLAPPTHMVLRAAQDEDGTPLAVSPLVALDWQMLTTVADEATGAVLEWPATDTVGGLNDERLSRQTGGAGLLRRQALSPFAAFVYHRLRVRELAPLPTGLSPARQGEWVHAVLARFWTVHRHSAALAAMSDDALDEHLRAIVADTAAHFVPASRYGTHLQLLESDRVSAVCGRWLMHERRRIDPFEVLYCEQRLTLSRPPLPLSLQLDRLDRVQTPDGTRFLVIDYKTGSATMSGWNGAVLSEPQLPLYAVAAPRIGPDVPHIDGICLARVDLHHPALLAATNWRPRLTEATEGDPAWKHVWPDECERWAEAIDALVSGYCAGDIRHRTATHLARDLALRAADFLCDAPTTVEADT
ncbi:MAG: PD-(D/E)XK nuclease family protein [Oceanococcaceae bacterium]